MVESQCATDKANDLYVFMVFFGDPDVLFCLDTVFDKIIAPNRAEKKKKSQVSVRWNV